MMFLRGVGAAILLCLVLSSFIALGAAVYDICQSAGLWFYRNPWWHGLFALLGVLFWILMMEFRRERKLARFAAIVKAHEQQEKDGSNADQS